MFHNFQSRLAQTCQYVLDEILVEPLLESFPSRQMVVGFEPKQFTQSAGGGFHFSQLPVCRAKYFVHGEVAWEIDLDAEIHRTPIIARYAL